MVLLSVVACLLLLLLLLIYNSIIKARRNLPPGPPAIPLIGHLHLFSKTIPPFKILCLLSQKYGGYMWIKFGSQPALVISSPAAARDVLKTHDIEFASRPRTAFGEAFMYDGAGVAFAPYGKHWRHLKKLCTLELFTAKRIEHFGPARAEEIKNCLNSLMGASGRNEVVNMSLAIYKFTFSLTLRMLMGKSYSSASEENTSDPAYKFYSMFLEASKLSSQIHVGECFPWLKWLDSSLPAMKRLGLRIDEFIQTLLDEHRASFQEENLRDMLDVLISISKDSQLSDTTIKAVTFELIGAGLETTAATVEWTLSELVRNPKIMEKALKELGATVPAGEEMVSENYLSSLHYLQDVVKESFRLHPPVPLLIPHSSTSDCKLESGYLIPKNTQTLINAFAIGRDGSVWENPLEFNPERMLNKGENLELGTSFEVLPFGAGRRICPGLNLGLRSVHFMLANLLYKFEWKTVEEVDVCEAHTFTLQRANPLRLIPVAKL